MKFKYLQINLTKKLIGRRPLGLRCRRRASAVVASQRFRRRLCRGRQELQGAAQSLLYELTFIFEAAADAIYLFYFLVDIAPN